MNLFRTDDDFGRVDNYSTLVAPFVEQRTVNQHLGTGLRGLDRNSRLQGSAINRLDRKTQTMQGVATPQFYQNFHGYFPPGAN